MLRLILTTTAVLLASPASRADNCDAIRAQIEAKIRASGVAAFTLSTVEAGAAVAGKVVGTCGLGTKKIVYAPSAVPAAPKRGPRDEPILTECKDGSVSLGGECKTRW